MKPITAFPSFTQVLQESVCQQSNTTLVFLAYMLVICLENKPKNPKIPTFLSFKGWYQTKLIFL